MEQVIAHFKKVDPVLAPFVVAGFKGKKPIALRSPAPINTYFKELAEAIVSQQLSVKAADTIWKRFEALLGGVVTPQNVLRHSVDEYRSVGMSRPKAGYLLAMAQSLVEGSVKLDHLDKLSDEEVMSELIKLKGIGPWSAEMFLMFTLGRPDIFSYLDLGLVRAFERVYGVENANRQIMEPYVLKWSPYRTYAALALWHSHDDNQPL